MTNDSNDESNARAKAALQAAGYRAWHRPVPPDASWTRHVHDINDPETREALRDWLRCTCRETLDPECLKHGEAKS
jgi:hypothetical protein